jgi:hypothetical protein
MRPSTVLTILACLAAAGCATVGDTLSADVWLCAYQLGDRYRDDAAKPTVIGYDTITSAPVRRTTLTYLVPAEGLPPTKHALTCDAAPYGFAVVAQDGFPLAAPAPAVYPGSNAIDPTVQGRTAEQVRDAVRQSGIHVQIPGLADSF